jgi:hypothetical protein
MSGLNSRVLETAAKMYAMREVAQKHKDYAAISQECQKRIKAVMDREKCNDLMALQIMIKNLVSRGKSDMMHFYVGGYLDMIEADV